MFWSIGAAVLGAGGVVWSLAGKHSKVRLDAPSRRIDEALQDPEAEAHLMRRYGSGNFFGPP